MLKKIVVKNYYSFKDSISLDFTSVGGYKFNTDCILKNVLGKIIIYGRNGTGKTNLGRAFGDISYVLRGFHSGFSDSVPLYNVNSSSKEIEFSYEFQFDLDNVIYAYTKNSNDDLIREKLIINDETIFDISFIDATFYTLQLWLVGAESIQTDKFLAVLRENIPGVEFNNLSSRVPFLRYLLSNAVFPGDSIIRRLETFIMGMRAVSFQHQLNSRSSILIKRFTESMSENGNLQMFEDFLRQMGFSCKLCIEEGIGDKKILCFDYNEPIPFFETASSGIMSLTMLYWNLVSRMQPSFLFLDEFDAFLHYEMSESLVNYLKEMFPQTQIVFTTHNTNLMTNHIMRPDCLFILSTDGRLTALCNATERELREGHNLEKLYIAGEFEDYE